MPAQVSDPLLFAHSPSFNTGFTLQCEFREQEEEEEGGEVVVPVNPAERNLLVLRLHRSRVTRKHFRCSGAVVLEVSIQVPVARLDFPAGGIGAEPRVVAAPRAAEGSSLHWTVCLPGSRGPSPGPELRFCKARAQPALRQVEPGHGISLFPFSVSSSAGGP
ncbi:hypothetical protein ACRRTK_013355 [Alexandromys fortis]